MCARKMEVCSDGRKMPSLPREARTVNTDKADGAADDWYQFSPWRAPGSAGVFDPCGTAGGNRRGSGFEAGVCFALYSFTPESQVACSNSTQ